jgi:tRNA threonylcarbamoyl adenosine modification protein (Sua5/YciO/YrdC/YwlC family)
MTKLCEMGTTYSCLDTKEALTGLRMARMAIGRGQLVVVPTDTVYGIAADAFNPDAVNALLAAKGRGRQSPPPVLIDGIPTLTALAETVTDEMTALVREFWPGGLTIVVPARETLQWDLGDTGGTVAVRMPASDIARELLSETGPLAVSSANLTGQPAASVPVGRTKAGLPVGLQIVGPARQDMLVMRAARALESVVGYRHLQA